MSDEAIQKPYVDYDYYSKDYRGTEASKTTFEQNLKWATALIDTITFGRIRSLEVIPDCVKDAICCAVEKYSTYQKLRNQELKSESNDGYSVSYADAGKESDMRQEVIADMKIYLSGTGLTYRGRSRKYDYKPGHHYFSPSPGQKNPEGGFYPYQHFGGIIRGYEIFRRISLRT